MPWIAPDEPSRASLIHAAEKWSGWKVINNADHQHDLHGDDCARTSRTGFGTGKTKNKLMPTVGVSK